MTRPPDWRCTKCGRKVTTGIASSIDPRYATGLCLHGTASTEHDPERVPLVQGEAKAIAVIDSRTEARTVTRALRKQIAGKDLSGNEVAALARRAESRGADR